jgi:hypothetical protein
MYTRFVPEWLLEVRTLPNPMGDAFYILAPNLRGFKVDDWWKCAIAAVPGVIIPEQGNEIDAHNEIVDEDADVKYSPRGFSYISHDENEHGKERNTWYVIVKTVKKVLTVTHIFSYKEAEAANAIQLYKDGKWVESRRTKKDEPPWSFDLSKMESCRV